MSTTATAPSTRSTPTRPSSPSLSIRTTTIRRARAPSPIPARARAVATTSTSRCRRDPVSALTSPPSSGWWCSRRRSWPGGSCPARTAPATMQGGDVDRFAADYLDHIADRLYSSVLADILDDAGYRHQVMRHDVRPLYPGAKAVGRAATMLAIEVTELPAEPYKLLMELLDGLQPGEIGRASCRERVSREDE